MSDFINNLTDIQTKDIGENIIIIRSNYPLKVDNFKGIIR